MLKVIIVWPAAVGTVLLCLAALMAPLAVFAAAAIYAAKSLGL
jgi:hypothetical protein